MEQKKAMIYAMLYFKDSIKIAPEVNFHELIIHANHGIPEVEPISLALQHIYWWINKTIAFMSHERCKCIRKVTIKDIKELQYYQPGKVFRMKNISSAYKSDNLLSVKRRYWSTNQPQTGIIVYFFIYSQMGKCIKEFFPPKLQIEHQIEDIIVFMAGTEFMVCKREQVYDD